MEQVECQAVGESPALTLPPIETLRLIAEKQDAKAVEIRERRRTEAEKSRQKRQRTNEDDDTERDAAAALIQKNYRGYRARRQLKGYDLNASSRWIQVMKDAKYHQSTAPMSREARASLSPGGSKQVRDRWRRVGAVAHRAGSDDTSSSSDIPDVSDPEEREKLRKRKERQREEMRRNAKGMGLEYFLELVDWKHRYGSSLRRYHNEWKKAETNENFFYWLDYGEGKELDLPDRPRERLDFERVRYLSPEERKKYEVYIDDAGLFRWKKDDLPVTTSVDYKDSIDGIVPTASDKPTWREVTTGVRPQPEPAPDSDASSSLSGLSTGSAEDGSKYANTGLHDAKGLNKLHHLSPDALMNHMLRKTTKKNTWIFCADTSFRLYIGIKQSGAFQHSSFLRGARVSAAGLIKIKRGQLRKLSPLSGHYAPPLKNFRAFLKNLKERQADLSRLNTGRSYAVLLGLEGYLGAKRRVGEAEQGLRDALNPEEKRRREREAMDGSASAAREREVVAMQERERREGRRKRSFGARVLGRLGYGGGGGAGSVGLKEKGVEKVKEMGKEAG